MNAEMKKERFFWFPTKDVRFGAIQLSKNILQ